MLRLQNRNVIKLGLREFQGQVNGTLNSIRNRCVGIKICIILFLFNPVQRLFNLLNSAKSFGRHRVSALGRRPGFQFRILRIRLRQRLFPGNSSFDGIFDGIAYGSRLQNRIRFGHRLGGNLRLRNRHVLRLRNRHVLGQRSGNRRAGLIQSRIKVQIIITVSNGPQSRRIAGHFKIRVKIRLAFRHDNRLRNGFRLRNWFTLRGGLRFRNRFRLQNGFRFRGNLRLRNYFTLRGGLRFHNRFRLQNYFRLRGGLGYLFNRISRNSHVMLKVLQIGVQGSHNVV